MKTRVLLLSVLLACAAATAFAAAPDGTVSGILTGFDGASLVVAVEGAKGKVASYAYKLAPDALVKRLDQKVAWLDAARKGLAVTLTAKAGTASAVDLPAYGLEARGVGFATEDPTILGVTDLRVNLTDSALAAPAEIKDAAGRVVSKTTVKEVEPADDEVWARADAKKLNLGNVVVVEGSVKVSLNGKELKVIYAADGAGKFEGDPGSSCIVDNTKKYVTIQFDVEIGADYDAANAAVKASWKKKMFEQSVAETIYKKIDPKAVFEFQGKSATLETVLRDANYMLIRCSVSDAIIHVDSYLVAREVLVSSASAKELKVQYPSAAKKPDAGTIGLSSGVTLADAKGGPVDPKALKGKTVLVTTEPADGYRAILVALKD
jgi:hypothetical protein